MRPAAHGALLALLVLLAGCCATAPPAEKYFSRASPVGTAWLFRYAVETHQYQAAWESLIPENRGQISVWKLGYTMRGYKPDSWGGVTVEEYLREAQWIGLDEEKSDLDAGEACVFMEYDVEGGENNIYHSFKLLLYDEDWLIDISGSLVPR